MSDDDQIRNILAKDGVKYDDDIDTVLVRLSGKKTNEYVYEKKCIYSLETEELVIPKRIERSLSGNYWQELYPLHPGKYLIIEEYVDDLDVSYKYKCLTVFSKIDYLAEKRRLFPTTELRPFKAMYCQGGFEISDWKDDIPFWKDGFLYIKGENKKGDKGKKEEGKKEVKDVDKWKKEGQETDKWKKEENVDREEYRQPKEVEDKLSLLCGEDNDTNKNKSRYLIYKNIGDNVTKNKKEDIVKVVYFKLGRMPEIGKMENTVEGMQKAIGGGYAQILKIGKNMAILCDEEGIIKALPHNRGLRGDWLIVGTRGSEFISLTDEQARWALENVKHINV